MEFEDVGELPDMDVGRAIRVAIDGVDVAVFRTVDGYLALDDRCPHAGGPLHQGRIDDDGVITCPWHAFRFCGRTGTCLVAAGRAGVRLRASQVEGGRLSIER
jgi:nitrite reductase/ring-hydroxylating ferredoxin subunit